MHALAQQLVGDLAHIVHFRNRHHGIAPQVRVHDDRLWIGVADHAQSLVAYEPVKLVLEFRPEIVAFKTVNRAVETPFGVERHHTGTLCAQVRIVVGAIEQVVDTRCFRNCSEEAAHWL